MPPDLYYEVIVPTLVENATFVGITTINKNPENFVNKLLELKLNSGEYVFHKVLVTMSCKKCEIEGKQMDCKHLEGSRPPWQSAERARDIEAIMKQERADDYMRETKGYNVDSSKLPAFIPSDCNRLLDNQIQSYRQRVTHIFVSVDPAAGGISSRFCIISSIYLQYFDSEQEIVSYYYFLPKNILRYFFYYFLWISSVY